MLVKWNHSDSLITTSEVLSDRRSKFIGRAARIQSKADAEGILQAVREMKAVRKATHHAMYAWRTNLDNEIREGSGDDGESGAGMTLLNMLRQTEWCNVIVIVTRFYGGKPLGPDRFRHIRAVAREALMKLKT